MGYSVDIEEVVWKIIDVLGDGFVAKLTEIEAAKTDPALTLDDIVRFYFGDKDNIPNQNMPAVLVKGRSFVPTPIATNNQYRDVIRIEIECYISSDLNATFIKDSRTYEFEEVLDVKIMRYARAIVELLAENEQLASKTTLLTFSDVMVSNILPLGDSMVKGCRIEVDYQGITTDLG